MCRRHIEHRRLPNCRLRNETKRQTSPRKFVRVLQHGLKHRMKFAGRTRNDLQHFRGGGLLLERLEFAQFVEQSRVLDGDDGLRAKFCTNSICLSVKGRTSCR